VAENVTTLRVWFDRFAAATGEQITHVVFAVDEWAWARTHWPEVVNDQLVPLDLLPESLLDRPFDPGFGGNNSPDMCAWSPSWVIFSDNYDGAECLQWIPRHPKAHQPIRPGGG